MKQSKFAAIYIFSLVLIVLSPVDAWAVVTYKYQLRIETGQPKRVGETAFSMMAAWKRGNEPTQKANGLIFVNGENTNKLTSESEVARKISKALNAGIKIKSPHDRGAEAKHTEKKPELVISNQAGFDMDYITVRDYSNQVMHFNIPGKSFQSASVKLAIDLVYSAAVEYVDGFSSGIKKETAGGYISVKMDQASEIKIKTDGKTTKELEKELAKLLGSGASFSSSAYYPNFVELRSKNYKSFDGGEVQLPALNAKKISIDIHDSGLGVLIKFDFPKSKKIAQSNDNNLLYVLLLVGLAVAYFFYKKKSI